VGYVDASGLRCAACDASSGYVATSAAGSDGAFCAHSDACGAAVPGSAAFDAATVTCVCAPGFRGASCGECAPQFSGDACDECADGYVDDDAARRCATCDTGAGYCASALRHSMTYTLDTNQSPADPPRGEPWSARQRASYENYAATPDPLQRGPYDAADKRAMPLCAPCAACDADGGGAVSDAGTAAAACVCAPLNITAVGSGASYAWRGGASCEHVTAVYSKDDREGSCFPSAARVLTEAGVWTRMDELATGTRVLSRSRLTGRATFSPVFAWLHADAHARSAMLRLTTDATHDGGGDDDDARPRGAFIALTLSHEHFLPAWRAGCTGDRAAPEIMEAQDVRAGFGVAVYGAADGAATTTAMTSRCALVTRVDVVGDARGLFNPLTVSGTLVVDSVLARDAVSWRAMLAAQRGAAVWGVRLPRAFPRAMQIHLPVYRAAWALVGQRGLDCVDAFMAPMYRAMRIDAPTNAHVARQLAARRRAATEAAAAVAAAAVVRERQGSADASLLGTGGNATTGGTAVASVQACAADARVGCGQEDAQHAAAGLAGGRCDAGVA
jgi:hypothetical protein